MSCDRDFGNTHSGDRSSIIETLNNRYNVPRNNLTKLNIIHSNCQSAMNKRSEIMNLIDAQNMHVLALTEFGASDAISD